MSEPKFTPGPWVNVTRYIESEKEHGIVNDGWRIAECMGSDGDANAHLIAAAPILYKALEAMLTYTADLNPMQGFDDLDHDAVKQAYYALARARGEGCVK